MQNVISEKHGYKKTKLGWIPEEWELHQFDEVFDFIKSYSFSRNDLTFDENEGDTFYIHYGDIHAKFDSLVLHLGEDNHSDIPLLKQSSKPGKELVYLQKGDLVIADASEDYDGVGECIEIGDLTNSKKLIAGLHTIVARDKSGITVDRYRVYILKNWPVAKELKKIATGISVFGISKGNLSKLKIPLPSLPEQKKIADILTTWDRAIKTLEQLIAKKKELKKGLMQQLLTGKKRFPGFEGEWKEMMLGECVIGKGNYGINAPSTKFSEDLPVYLRITDIDERGKFSTENKTSVDDENYSDYLLEEGDIVFARTGNTTGKTYLYDKRDGELVYAGFLIRFKPDPNILLPKFLKYYTDTHRYWYWVSVMSARSGQPGINSTEYSKLTFKIPPVEEQKKIIDTIDHVYSEITRLGRLKGKFQQQKTGIMQQLLTGKTRVKM